MRFQKRLFTASAFAILVALIAINPFGRHLVDPRPTSSIPGDDH
jgi:hypothetical protein